MQNNNPARNLPWFNTTVAEAVAGQLVHADQASRSAWRVVGQVEALLDEQLPESMEPWQLELAELVQTMKTCTLSVRASLQAASREGTQRRG